MSIVPLERVTMAGLTSQKEGLLDDLHSPRETPARRLAQGLLGLAKISAAFGDIVLVLAGHAAEEFIQDKELQVRISDSLLTGESHLNEEGKLAILGLSSDMLREGLELASDSDIEGGARVRLVQDKLEIDLSDRAIARMISQRLLPRFKAILEGVE